MKRNVLLSRRGTTLVEMLMVITIMAVVLGMSVVQMQLLVRLDQGGRARIDQATAWDRLGRQLRVDVHDAETAEPFAENQAFGLRVRLPGATEGQIEYWIDRTEIVRIELAKGKMTRREVYSIPRLIDARFEGRTESGRRFVAFVLTTTVAKARDAPQKIDEILVAVGLNRDRASSNPKGVKS